MIEKILEQYDGEELITADGFDDAIIGIDPYSLRIIYLTPPKNPQIFSLWDVRWFVF